MNNMSLSIACSTTSDGSMKPLDGSFASVLPARQSFLEKNGMHPVDTTLVRLIYEGKDYTRYSTVSQDEKGAGIVCETPLINDGLVVTEPGHALFLPLADCIGAVIHDPTKNTLMLSHLGRHNLEQYGGTKSIEYLVKEHGVNPKDLTIWLSPAAGKEYYPLYAFDNRSLHDVATEQLIAAGVRPEAIERSPIDSAADPRYYSHSQFLKGHRPDDSRFAVAAMLTS
jgi:copper oxidase (laccase) domain-containing protein